MWWAWLRHIHGLHVDGHLLRLCYNVLLSVITRFGRVLTLCVGQLISCQVLHDGSQGPPGGHNTHHRVTGGKPTVRSRRVHARPTHTPVP